MGLLNFIKRKSNTKVATNPHEIDLMLREYLMGSSSGVNVTSTRAMQNSVYFACVKILAESVAQLPLILYRRNGDFKSRATDENLYDILHFQPNDFQTSFEFIEFLTAQYVGSGNAYAFINWQKNKVVELLPFQSSAVEPQMSSDWVLSYRVTFKNGKKETIPASDILHIKGMTLNGYTGLNPITYMRESLGLSLATEAHGARLFKNGARPSGLLSTPNELSDEARARIAKGWKAAHGGDNQGGTAVLEQDLKYTPISMTAEDAQFLETRRFQVEEIARVFRVPLHMLQHTEKTTSWGSGVEHMTLGFVKFTLLPHLKRWEQAIRRDLLNKKQKKELYAEFLVEGMERGDIKSRYESYGTGIEKGILSPNEVRKKENMNPREGGDMYLRPLNMDISGNGEGETLEDGQKSINISTKSAKGIQKRNELQQKITPKLKKIAEKIVNYEVIELKKAIKKHINRKSVQSFEGWLDDFYKEFSPTIKEKFEKTVKSHSNNVMKVAVDEVDSHNIDVDEFSSDYTDGFVKRYVDSSIGQIKTLIKDTDSDEIEDVLETRIDEWEEKRPDKVANNESVRIGVAVARFTWAACGVTALIWVTQGSKTCPFCKQMNGKVVGIDKPFLDSDETLTASDGSGLKITGRKMHAPIHKGCVCTIIPKR